MGILPSRRLFKNRASIAPFCNLVATKIRVKKIQIRNRGSRRDFGIDDEWINLAGTSRTCELGWKLETWCGVGGSCAKPRTNCHSSFIYVRFCGGKINTLKSCPLYLVYTPHHTTAGAELPCRLRLDRLRAAPFRSNHASYVNSFRSDINFFTLHVDIFSRYRITPSRSVRHFS